MASPACSPMKAGGPMADGSDHRVLVLSPIAHSLLLKLTEAHLGLHEDVQEAPTLAEVGDALLARDALYVAIRRAAR